MTENAAEIEKPERVLYYHNIPLLDIQGLTEFQKKVYGVTRMLPAGSVSSYGTIGKVIQCKSSQAVGQALKRNPWPFDAKNVDPNKMVPCHRVIAKSGCIGGFSGKRKGKSIERKINLLKNEGVLFQETKSGKIQIHRDCKHKMITQFQKVTIEMNSSSPSL